MRHEPLRDDVWALTNRIMEQSTTTIFLLDENGFVKVGETPTAIVRSPRKQSEIPTQAQARESFFAEVAR